MYTLSMINFYSLYTLQVLVLTPQTILNVPPLTLYITLYPVILLYDTLNSMNNFTHFHLAEYTTQYTLQI